jgi:hypothetical protein
MSYAQFITALNRDPRNHSVMFKLPMVGTMFRVRFGRMKGWHGVVVPAPKGKTFKHSFTARVCEFKDDLRKGAGSLQQMKLRHTSLYPQGCVRQINNHPGIAIEVVDWRFIHPEHREDEERVEDPVFDHSPDTFLPAPEGLDSLQQIEFQELYKKSGRVIGRHDTVVDIPWYLTQQFVTRRAQCTPQQASDLLEPLKALEANEAVVLEALAEVKVKGIDAATASYQALANAMRALDPDPEDAMEHRNTEGLAHEERWGSIDTSAEWAMLLDEGVPSAASIAHSLGVSLKAAGDIREDMLLQDMDAAGRKAIASQEDVIDEDELDFEGDEHDDDDRDFSGFVAEGWHLMDDKGDEDSTLWIDLQPVEVQDMFLDVEESKTLASLKTLGQEVYSLTSWTSAQRAAFWSLWHARRNALLLQTEQRLVRVRKAVAKIERTGAAELPQLGKRLFDLTKANPNFYPAEGWARLWAVYKERKAGVKPGLSVRRELAIQLAEWQHTHA